MFLIDKLLLKDSLPNSFCFLAWLKYFCMDFKNCRLPQACLNHVWSVGSLGADFNYLWYKLGLVQILLIDNYFISPKFTSVMCVVFYYFINLALHVIGVLFFQPYLCWSAVICSQTNNDYYYVKTNVYVDEKQASCWYMIKYFCRSGQTQLALVIKHKLYGRKKVVCSWSVILQADTLTNKKKKVNFCFYSQKLLFAFSQIYLTFQLV